MAPPQFIIIMANVGIGTHYVIFGIMGAKLLSSVVMVLIK